MKAALDGLTHTEAAPHTRGTGSGSGRCGLLARLKAIGVNLFRAAKVGRRVLDALKPVPRAVSAIICSIIGDVKEHFLSVARLNHIFKSAIENILYTVRVAA